jgi:hypothetical protein
MSIPLSKKLALAGRGSRQKDEKNFIETMISYLNRELIVDLDPNLSAKRPSMYPAVRAGSVEADLIIGGSNARNPAFAVASLEWRPISWRKVAGRLARRILTS